MVFEYKLNRWTGANGKVVKGTPAWVEDGGYFYNSADLSMVGWSPNEAVRDYYVPDSVVVFADVVALQTRLQAMHTANPFMDPITNVALTAAEVDTMVSDWWIAKEGI